MTTALIEFPNNKGLVLRGILSTPGHPTNTGTICIHGFNRFSSAEKKFKRLSDALVEQGQTVLRFDFPGCGLSDGEFRTTTLHSLSQDLNAAWNTFIEYTDCSQMNVVTHSLGGAILANLIQKQEINTCKIVLIAPALNQEDLLRYWFVTSLMKKEQPLSEVTWNNFKQHLNEELFLQDCNKSNRMTKTDYIDSAYFLGCKDLDFSTSFTNTQNNVLHIHGEKDTTVPLESIKQTFPNRIIVQNGDHDLERPDMMEQWLSQAVAFLTKKT